MENQKTFSERWAENSKNLGKLMGMLMDAHVDKKSAEYIKFKSDTETELRALTKDLK